MAFRTTPDLVYFKQMKLLQQTTPMDNTPGEPHESNQTPPAGSGIPPRAQTPQARRKTPRHRSREALGSQEEPQSRKGWRSWGWVNKLIELAKPLLITYAKKKLK